MRRTLREGTLQNNRAVIIILTIIIRIIIESSLRLGEPTRSLEMDSTETHVVKSTRQLYNGAQIVKQNIRKIDFYKAKCMKNYTM